MEVCCRWCMKVDTCDHVDEWVMEPDGLYRGASKVESCPDFVCNPEYHAELLAKGIQACDPEEYKDVAVNLVFGGRIDIAIVTTHNFTQQEAHERIEELQEDLQELNDEILHIVDADFYISFMYPRENRGGPQGVDEDGNVIETNRRLDDVDIVQEAQNEPRECPICNTVFRAKECPGCGYVPVDESWRD